MCSLDSSRLFNYNREVEGNYEWCREHFLNYRSLQTAVKIRKQLLEYCQSQSFRIESCGGEKENILKAFVAGGFLKVAVRMAAVLYRNFD